MLVVVKGWSGGQKMWYCGQPGSQWELILGKLERIAFRSSAGVVTGAMFHFSTRLNAKHRKIVL